MIKPTMLSELYKDKRWDEFAAEFLKQYRQSGDAHKLRLLRELLSKYRHNSVLKLIGPHLC